MDFLRSSGILVHPTSFPSKYGIGDLGDSAIQFIDFLKKSKQNLWQVLPLGPTSFGDSPYQSFSTFAGNHLLISPDILNEEGFISNEDISEVPDFNDKKVDYGNVIIYKTELFYKAYKNFTTSSTKKQKMQYNAFCKGNKDWLDDYCLFVAIKSHYIKERKFSYDSIEQKKYAERMNGKLSKDELNDYFYGAVWNSWSDDLVNRKPAAIKEWTKKLQDSVDFHKFLQYEFFREWSLIKSYANKNNIQVIGDIPIFVACDSADAWTNKDMFYFDEQGIPTSVAGVPPDYFSATGQLWGNPLYDWDKHEASGYSWWISRIEKNLALFDIIRIDHFRGFESFWSVPYGEKTAINGKWEKGPGKKLFAEIKKKLGDLPIIAEDLGIITEKVTNLRESLTLPGMKVLHFGFSNQPGNLNLPMNIESNNCVIYTGTHDNDTTVGWYLSEKEENRDQFRRYMNVSGDDPSWDLIRLAFFSVAKIAIIPIQDIMSLGSDDRMNIPGIASGNWQFRYTSDMLEDMYAEKLAYLSAFTGRYKIYDEKTIDTSEIKGEITNEEER